MLLHSDLLTRRLYASDASLYEELPEAVCFPTNTSDLAELVKLATLRQTGVTLRAAGTSLAGQTTGAGIIADISRHMNRVLHIDPANRSALVEPGVIRDQLNREAARHGLLFGPDTSTTDRCMLGGMIGNNSCGSYSIRYGTTREHVLSLDTVLSDGSSVTFRPLTETELAKKTALQTLEGTIYREMLSLLTKHRELIFERFPHPDVKRRNTGYALDRLCEMHPIIPGGRDFNLCELLCGSEGTLALTRRALLRLVPLPAHRVLVIPHFQDLNSALQAVADIVSFDPAAVELVDHNVLQATLRNPEQKRNRFFLQGNPGALLITELQGDSLQELIGRARELATYLQKQDMGYAWPVLEELTEINRVWDLRKAGLGLLAAWLDDANSPEFVDDTAVRVEDLPQYIQEFQSVLNRHNTESVYYAHASVGELHLRPKIDIKTIEGIQTMKAIALETAELVHKFRGSLSGEHGDGRLRAHLIEHMVGPEIMTLFRTVKQLWDPSNILNPGKILDAPPMDSHLRYAPGYRPAHVSTTFHWRAENGFSKALELCNGAGVCRRKAESGGTMCPSYKATLEEIDSTRGRANLFRQIFSERQVQAFRSPEIKQALELCLSCKACKTECPASVDMARMKAEFMHGWQREHGPTLADRFFGNPAPIYKIATKLPRTINILGKTPLAKGALRHLFGIDPRRSLPKFSNQKFFTQLRKQTPENKPAIPPRNSPQRTAGKTGKKQKAVLLVDVFTDAHEPQVAWAALRIMRALGWDVSVAGPVQTGRTHISRGRLDQAAQLCEANLKQWAPYAANNTVLVGLEPGEVFTWRDEYPDLCPDNLLEQSHLLAGNTLLFEEWFLGNSSEEISRQFNAGGQNILVHSHCYTKAITGPAPVLQALQKAGYQPQELNAGCCGMAGSFGYAHQNYAVSMAIAEQVLFPSLRDRDVHMPVCAHGFSCRHQIADGTNRVALHTAEYIWQARTGATTIS